MVRCCKKRRVPIRPHAGITAATAFHAGTRLGQHPPKIGKQLGLQGQMLLLLLTEDACLLLCHLLCTLLHQAPHTCPA